MARSKSMVEHFAEVTDSRVERTKQHELVDILCLAVLAVIAGAEGWGDIEAFGRDKQVWLKQYLRLANGIPSHDTINRVFRMIKPVEFEAAFLAWIDALHDQIGTRQIAIDGKTPRRSHSIQVFSSAICDVTDRRCQSAGVQTDVT